MELAERETQIMAGGSEVLANQADLHEGFFYFYTSDPADFRRLCRIIGGQDKLVSLRVSTQKGETRTWQAKVPARFYKRQAFGIGRPRKLTMSKERRVAAGDRLKAWRTAQEATTQ